MGKKKADQPVACATVDKYFFEVNDIAKRIFELVLPGYPHPLPPCVKLQAINIERFESGFQVEFAPIVNETK